MNNWTGNIKRYSPFMMLSSMLLLGVMIFLWLMQSYSQQREVLQRELDFAFSESIKMVQDEAIQVILRENLSGDSVQGNNRMIHNDSTSAFAFINMDSKGFTHIQSAVLHGSMNTFSRSGELRDTQVFGRNILPPNSKVIMKINTQDSSSDNTSAGFSVIRLDQSLSIDTTYLVGVIRKALNQNNVKNNFILHIHSTYQITDSLSWNSTKGGQKMDNNILMSKTLPVGLPRPDFYNLELKDVGYLITKRMLPQISFAFFLFAMTGLSFFLIYRTMQYQSVLASEKSSFITNMTHELKTPVATVGVALEAIQHFNVLNDFQKTEAYLKMADHELKKLNGLVESVIHLTMMEDGEIPLEFRYIDLKEVMDKAIMRLKIQAYAQNSVIHFSYTSSDFPVYGDPNHLENVCINLIDNALKYSGESGEVNVKIEKFEDWIKFSINDNGPGIDPIYQEKIFDRFFRIPTGDVHSVKGYGLGLSYVAYIVDKHRGNIKVNSTPGKGSSFVVKIPTAYGKG